MKDRNTILWSTLVLVSLVVVAGCAADTSGQAAPLGRERSISEAAVVRKYVTHGDNVCNQLAVGRESLADVVFGEDASGAASIEQEVSFFEGLFPITQAYVQSLATLDAPTRVSSSVSTLVARGYGAELLLWQAIDAHRRADLGAYERTKLEMAALASGSASVASQLQGLGFETCTAEQAWLVPGPGSLGSAVPLANPFTIGFVTGSAETSATQG